MVSWGLQDDALSQIRKVQAAIEATPRWERAEVDSIAWLQSELSSPDASQLLAQLGHGSMTGLPVYVDESLPDRTIRFVPPPGSDLRPMRLRIEDDGSVTLHSETRP